MTDAYLHVIGGADGKGHYSPELDMLQKIDRFGVESILGRRQLYYGELRRMIIAENIQVAYRSRQQSKTWSEWANKFPQLAEILANVEKLCQ